VRAARPFEEVRHLPPELRLPAWFPLTLGAIVVAGLLIGLAPPGPPFARIANAIFSAALYMYIAVSLLDAAEHFRLERHVTGRYLAWAVVPPGESLVHVAIMATLVAAVSLARPIQAPLALRDLLVLGTPVLFLILGWSDELIYHRRRALHREDILHTLSHLAAGLMIVALFVAKVLDWSQFR
jgi:hypothetical protein